MAAIVAACAMLGVDALTDSECSQHVGQIAAVASCAPAMPLREVISDDWYPFGIDLDAQWYLICLRLVVRSEHQLNLIIIIRSVSPLTSSDNPIDI